MNKDIPCQNKQLCTGCMACVNVCQSSAIKIKENEDGFLEPYILENACTKCNLCRIKCPINHLEPEWNIINAYAAYVKDSSLRKSSSSGGIFSMISSLIIKYGGIVYGAAFDDNYNVKHVRCETIEELYYLRGAKYVQSDISNIYEEIKMFLNEGKLVYFVGTPCQVAGLKSYLGKQYTNFISSDLICHGVPSPAVWRKFLLEKNVEDIKNISFRDKRFGWENYSLVIKSDDKELVYDRYNNDYMKGFLDNFFLRNSCYECKFKGYVRVSDITLADFWGINNIDANFDKNNEGTSLILINSRKGQRIFDLIQDDIVSKKVDYKEAISYNKSAIFSSYYPVQRKRFLKKIQNNNFSKVLNDCQKLNFKERVIIKLKR